jgi:hypothetical protein
VRLDVVGGIPSVKGLMIALIVVWVILANLQRRESSPRTTASATLVKNVAVALKTFQNDYGAFPSGDYSQICRALFGENPKQQTYFNREARSINASGEIVDEWGTPLRVDFAEHPQAPRIQSAGKNRIFEGRGNNSDDLYSWDEK